jgi:hypothetical protein
MAICFQPNSARVAWQKSQKSCQCCDFATSAAASKSHKSFNKNELAIIASESAQVVHY